MKKELTEIIVVMDQSGSMDSIKTDAIGGFNTFLSEQKKVPGKARFTLVLFDSQNYKEVYLSESIKKVKPLDESTYIPGASTPLLDAVGRAIDKVGAKLAELPESERPEKVVFVVLTDGHENASTDYTKDKVKSMIKHQSDVYKWQFVFLGVNIDAFDSFTGGVAIGVGLQGCCSTQGAQGASGGYSMASNAVRNYRSGQTSSVDMSSSAGGVSNRS